MACQLKSKIWLERENRKIFGDGPFDILKRVERTGSLRQAAAEINMSYSQAWRLVWMIEKNLGLTLLEKQAGGRGGGHSSLTEEARTLIRKYEFFRRDSESSLDRLFEKYLASIIN